MLQTKTNRTTLISNPLTVTASINFSLLLNSLWFHNFSVSRHQLFAFFHSSASFGVHISKLWSDPAKAAIINSVKHSDANDEFQSYGDSFVTDLLAFNILRNLRLYINNLRLAAPAL